MRGSIWGSHSHQGHCWWAEGRFEELGWAELKPERPPKRCGTRGWASFSTRSPMFWENSQSLASCYLKLSTNEGLSLVKQWSASFLKSSKYTLAPLPLGSSQPRSFWWSHLFTVYVSEGKGFSSHTLISEAPGSVLCENNSYNHPSSEASRCSGYFYWLTNSSNTSQKGLLTQFFPVRLKV